MSGWRRAVRTFLVWRGPVRSSVSGGPVGRKAPGFSRLRKAFVEVSAVIARVGRRTRRRRIRGNRSATCFCPAARLPVENGSLPLCGPARMPVSSCSCGTRDKVHIWRQAPAPPPRSSHPKCAEHSSAHQLFLSAKERRKFDAGLLTLLDAVDAKPAQKLYRYRKVPDRRGRI